MRLTGFLALAILTASTFFTPTPSQAGVFLSITVAPPPLPVYEQPPIPGPDYIWTPGYWAWDDDDGDYYWVPGVWEPAPEPGLLWTPAYWGWDSGVYVFHDGYWGPHVGFYGGVCYGYGYTGVGFVGGFWRGGSFSYNRSVTNITNVTIIKNTYNKTVINNNVTNVSFNGGAGGIQRQPTPDEKKAEGEKKLGPTDAHKNFASNSKTLDGSHFKANNGAPKNVAANSITNPKFIPAKSAGIVKPSNLTNNPAGSQPGGKNSLVSKDAIQGKGGNNKVLDHKSGPDGAGPKNSLASKKALQGKGGNDGAGVKNSLASKNILQGKSGNNRALDRKIGGDGPRTSHLNQGRSFDKPIPRGPNNRNIQSRTLSSNAPHGNFNRAPSGPPKVMMRRPPPPRPAGNKNEKPHP